MGSKVPLGWDVKMAIDGSYSPIGVGRAVVVGANYWASNGGVGFYGFDGGQIGPPDERTIFQADSRRTLQAIVKWLTGKTSGANILIMGDGVDLAFHLYNTQFKAGLEFYGHIVTWTGTSTPDWIGFEPLDYDLLCGQGSITTSWSYHGVTAAQDKLDYLLSHGGHVLWNGSHLTFWPAYGFGGEATGHVGVNDPPIAIHFGDKGPPDWENQRPFSCIRFGDPGIGGSWATNFYALVMQTTGYVTEVTLNRPGAREVYYCDLEEYGLHTNRGTVGLYSSDGIML